MWGRDGSSSPQPLEVGNRDRGSGRYLGNSVTGAQLLPSGKQKRGMACKRRSSSSFWPFSKFSRWNEVMPRVRVMGSP